MNIAIIGAGVTGLTTAYYLAKQGQTVTVYEQESYAGMKCSHANGGQVSVSNSEVWTTWANLIKGVRWMFKSDAPLLVRPSLDLDKAAWLAKFCLNTARGLYQVNTLKTIAMGIESQRLYQDLVQSENLNFDQTNKGILHVYKSEKYFLAGLKAKNLYDAHSVDFSPVNYTQMCDLEPALANMSGIIGGIYTSTDWTGDIHKFCVELSYLLRSKYNVTFKYQHRASPKDYLDHDRVVVCAGVDSQSIGRHFDDHLDIYPVKGYSITLPAHDVQSYQAMPKVSLLDDQTKIVCSFLGDKLRIAGTAEFDGHNYDIRHARIQPLLNWVKDNFHNISRETYTSWACLRPMTPTMLPVVSQSSSNKKVYYNTGHGHLGWTLAPATAKKISDLIC